MRADVARHYGGTPFDQKYIDMQKNAPQQLFILFHEAKRHREREQDSRFERDEAFVKISEMFVEYLSFFINRDLYEEVQKSKEMKKHEAELTPEQFTEEFKQIDKMGLKRLYVPELEKQEEPEAPALSPEMAAAFTGGGISEFRRLSSAFNDEKEMDHQPISVGMNDIDMDGIED